MRIIKEGNIYKIQKQKFTLFRRKPYWETLSYKDVTTDLWGSAEFTVEYTFGSVEEAEKFVTEHYGKKQIEVIKEIIL